MHRHIITAILSLAALFTAAYPVAAQPGDAVESLRLILKTPIVGEDQDLLEQRSKALAGVVAALKTPGELRRALQLPEWRDDSRFVSVSKVDAKARTQVGDRLLGELSKAIADGDEGTRLGAAEMLASLGPVRGIGLDSVLSFGRMATPLLQKLCLDKSAKIRAAAALALGRIHPEPGLAAVTFESLLKDKEVSVRRAAARGLCQFVEETALLQKQGRSQIEVVVKIEDVVDAGKAALPLVAIAVKDADAEVRRHGQETLKAAAQALAELIPDPFQVGDFPPAGTKLTARQQNQQQSVLAELEAERKLLLPLINALKAHPALLAGLGDADANVLRVTAEAAETLALVRKRLLARMVSGPPPVAVFDDFGASLAKMVPPLGEKLSHQEVSVRLAVLYALETLEMDAAPAAPAVVKALADDNSFVRWGATRALGRMAPLTGKDSAAAVKALGKAVADEKENVRVRNAAAAALARFGIAAKEAVPGLSAAVSKGEPELRVNGMRALQAIGAAAQDAVPTVSAALQTKDTPLAVRLEAAKTLAKLGPAAAAGRPALLEALNDPHPEIRLAAAEALLTIGAKEK